MKINAKVLTPSGVILHGDYEHFVASGDEGQVGVYFNHIPIILKISQGFVKLVDGDENTYVVVSNGVLDFNKNTMRLIAQNVQIGTSLETTKKEMHLLLKERLKESKQQMVDFVGAEKELARTIQEVIKNKL